MSIITLTVNPALDKSVSVEQLIPKVKLNCSDLNYEPGGGGINVARVMQRLGKGARAIMQSAGPSGQRMQELLNREGIDYTTFETRDWTRENCIVKDEFRQEQYRLNMPGPEFKSEEVEELEKLVKRSLAPKDLLVLSGSLAPGLPDNFYARLIVWAKTKGIKVVLDTSGMPLQHALKEGVYMAKPNLRELAHLVGKEELSGTELEQEALALVSKGAAELFVVSLGAKGAFMASAEGIVYLSSPDIQPKSAVGAGDSMVAGMVYASYLGLSNQEVLRYGVACGTAATLTEGTELCRKEDVLKMLNLVKIT